MTRKLELRRIATMAVAAAVAAGCASSPFPAEKYAASESAIAAARAAGAAELAPRELGLAQDKLALSKRFIAANDAKPARWLVEQAQVDAELAAVKALSARAVEKATIAARELRDRNVRVAQTRN
jgi:uncharacterized protein DUF4398